MKAGTFNTEIIEENIMLYRISDITFTHTLLERICGTGTITVISTDKSLPEAKIMHVKNAGKVKDLLQQSVEKARQKSGVAMSELVGTAGHHCTQECRDIPEKG